jgi:hypothetical protein
LASYLVVILELTLEARISLVQIMLVRQDHCFFCGSQ